VVVKIPWIRIPPIRIVGSRTAIKIDVYFGRVVSPSAVTIIVINFVLI
jgi:hypothetical protein